VFRPDDKPTAYLALGANLGDRLANLRAAVTALAAAPGVEVAARSGIYETAAVAETAQPDYLNAVLRVQTAWGPRPLLDLCLEIERRLGRVRPPGRDKAPRSIDLDLLLHGAAVLDQPGLQLPHPGLLHRPFVLVPLADVAAPGLRHPVTGTPLGHAVAPPDVRLWRAADAWSVD
jgi:2-amino-4-hydroxy-6-hydroxymethyldihydropteridine diphosphokinase